MGALYDIKTVATFAGSQRLSRLRWAFHGRRMLSLQDVAILATYMKTNGWRREVEENGWVIKSHWFCQLSYAPLSATVCRYWAQSTAPEL
jgi:hypothetical protein